MQVLANDPNLQWSSAKLKMYKNLSCLVQNFQVDYANQGSSSSPRGLILPPELIPYSEKADTDLVPDEVIRSAQKDIVYYDDVPCIDGVPIYDRLSGEPVPFFSLFKAYRELKERVGTRSMVKLHEETGVPMDVIQVINRVWHWQVRVQPYDRQIQLNRSWERQRQARAFDATLTKRGADLIEMAMCYLEQHEMQLDPKVAVDLIKTLVPITRVASGMQADKPADAEGAVQGLPGGGSGSGVGASVNVSVQNNTASGNGTVHGMAASEVIVKTEKQNEDPGHLASILNVLNQSGAFERVVLEQEGALDTEFVPVVDEGDDFSNTEE